MGISNIIESKQFINVEFSSMYHMPNQIVAFPQMFLLEYMKNKNLRNY